MRTISQTAELTGISIRTLQYYDEIGLLKPSSLTPSGYRLYDDSALETLQQILFFKELGFPLKKIREILEEPGFDRIAAFKNQKRLLLLKRNRIDRLIQLLERLEKGENCMSFKEFDLSDYLHALENFKHTQEENVIRHWGSVENFDLFIQKIREDEEHVAQVAIQEFGSIEKYTEAMKYNLEHFSEIMEDWTAHISDNVKKTGDLFSTLAAHRGEDPSSPGVQKLVEEIIARAFQVSPPDLIGDTGNYCQIIIDAYSNDYTSRILDSEHGQGYCAYIVEAFRYYAEHLAPGDK